MATHLVHIQLLQLFSVCIGPRGLVAQLSAGKADRYADQQHAETVLHR